MQKLYPDKQYPVSKESLTPILSQYSITDFTFEALHGGIANTTVRIEHEGKRFVLRVYRQERKSDEVIALEIEFQDFLRPRGIPIPLIFKNRDGSELTIHAWGGRRWQCILIDFVSGTVRTPYTPELIAELSHIQATIHRLGAEFAKMNGTGPPWADFHLGHAPEPADFPDSETQAFISRMRAYRYLLGPTLPYGYNHLDLDLYGNIAVKDNRIAGIFDFDDLEFSPIVACLGNTLWDILFDSSENDMWNYLESYEKARPLTTNERDALPQAVLFRNYAVAADVLLTGRHLDELPRFIEHERRIPVMFKNRQSE